MYEVIFLVLFPLLAALLLLVVKGNARKLVVWISSVAIIGDVLYVAYKNYISTGLQTFVSNADKVGIVNITMLAIEVIIVAFILYVGIKYKKWLVCLLALAQIALTLWLELSGRLEELELPYNLYIDKLAIIMGLIIAVVGCLIAIYSLGYMKGYHEHHKEFKDRSKMLFAVVFLFLGAMFGLVFSNNLMWIYFFWEITTLCSFILIGYTKTDEAKNNAFKALWMNLLGGLAFNVAIIYSVIKVGTIDLQDLVSTGSAAGKTIALLPIILLAFAGLTKSAQLPFSSWLLGAMVAPTPSSALLHSATMVKAGVYLLVRMAPALGHNYAGYMVAFVGGFTFLVTSLLAIDQSDAKKVLAYSTIANLGLMVTCAGIGSAEAVWAAVFLIIFHAVSKSLMFLSVGATENRIHSRDIEDYQGLLTKFPQLAFVMTVGIAGMYLAPFGMLISKWAALKAFIDAGTPVNIIVILFLCFGSAATLFYWTKWMGKLVAVVPNTEKGAAVKGNEWISMIIHAVIMIGLCFTFPLVSSKFVLPYLNGVYGANVSDVLSKGNIYIMMILIAALVILPLFVRIFAVDKRRTQSTIYMNGANAGDDLSFINAFGNKQEIALSNWYVDKYFGEKKLLVSGVAISAAAIVSMLAIVIGGVL